MRHLRKNYTLDKFKEELKDITSNYLKNTKPLDRSTTCCTFAFNLALIAIRNQNIIDVEKTVQKIKENKYVLSDKKIHEIFATGIVNYNETIFKKITELISSDSYVKVLQGVAADNNIKFKKDNTGKNQREKYISIIENKIMQHEKFAVNPYQNRIKTL